jgi:hypothetical protein
LPPEHDIKSGLAVEPTGCVGAHKREKERERGGADVRRNRIGRQEQGNPPAKPTNPSQQPESTTKTSGSYKIGV